MKFVIPARSRSDTGDGELSLYLRSRQQRLTFVGWYYRICPGRHFGDASVWLTVASILHTFNIRPPLDEKGETIALTPKFTDGLVS